MPLALLLSPDDQAVSAITAVLEEMSVTCERPLDGASAAQKLNSSSFDLVVVDCENLPAAKLIFDVCRRGKGSNNPVQIAIVDGRAGLPTAFRLGAELILTKPVAKDQARSTIRTAVSRVKKEEPACANHFIDQINAFSTDSLEHGASQPSAVQTDASEQSVDQPTATMGNHEFSAGPASQAIPAERAMVAAAAAGASQLTFSDPVPAPTLSPSAVTASAPVIAASASAAAATTSAAVAEPASAAALAVETPSLAAESKPQAPAKLSDDPVLAELEQAEAEPKPQPAVVSSTPEKQDKPSQTKEAQGKQDRKSRGSLIVLFVLLLACAASYFAWTYEPGFQALAQSQINHVLVLTGISHPAKPVPPKPAKTATQPAVPVAATPATTAQPSLTPGATPSTAATTSGTAPAPLRSSPTPASATATTAASATSGSATPAVGTASTAPVAAPSPASKPARNQVDLKKPEPAKISVNPSPANQSKAAAPSDAELPGEKTAIILSSKGAEKRLAHSVQPVYPAGTHPAVAEGTMVLKAVIDENGKVTGARVVEGNAALAQAAIGAVMQFRYRPYVRDGKVLPFQTIVLVDFQQQ